MSANERIGGMLIFCIVLLGSFIALIAAIPTEFYEYSEEYEMYDYPSYFSMEDIENIKYFLNHTITKDTAGGVEFDFNPDIDFKFKVFWFETLLANRMYIRRVASWWIFTWQYHMNIETEITMKDIRYIYIDDLVSHWDQNYNASDFYPVKDNKISVKVWITDPNETRQDIEEAWDEGELNVGIGFGYDDIVTKLSVWSIVGRLLTFQAPEVFGLTGVAATIINLLIALPLWACIAYLVYRLILLAIPFTGG